MDREVKGSLAEFWGNVEDVKIGKRMDCQWYDIVAMLR
jgi:hypothetical protein